MLAIQQGQYTFPVYIEEDGDDIEIYIGKASNNKYPCIHVSIYKRQYVVLQDLVYLPHCIVSRTNLEKRNGSVVIMLKAVLKWLIKHYDFVRHVVFTDNSYFDSRLGQLLLPERMMLTEGQTWYMKHFGAKPGNIETKSIYKRYKQVYNVFKDDFVNVQDETWLYKNLVNLFTKYPPIKNKIITGTTWKISRKTIDNYDVNPVEVQVGGGKIEGETLKQLYLKHKRYDRPRRVFI